MVGGLFWIQRLVGAVSVIILLWLLIVWTIANMYMAKKAAAWLMVPYLLWVSFATVLNVWIAYYN